MLANEIERKLVVYAPDGLELTDPEHPDVIHLNNLLENKTRQAKQLEREVSRLKTELADVYRTRDTLGRMLSGYFASWIGKGGALAMAVARALGKLRVGIDRLVPLSDISRQSDGTWKGSSYGQFLVPILPTRGYLRLRAVVDAPGPSRATLYYDTGNAFNTREVMDLGAVHENTRIERIVPLPVTAYQLRFDAIQNTGEFTVKEFSIEPTSRIAINTAALMGNVRKLMAGGPYRPSVKIALKLLLSGQWGVFHRQLMHNASATKVTDEYDLWLQRHAITDADRKRMQRTIAGWPNPPKISIVLPVYNVAETYLRLCIDSVLKQTYPHWELCIADDASPAPHVKTVLKEYAARDPRIKVKFRETNGNISAASNSALELVTGEWVALLDHDDELTEHALFRMAETIVKDPAVDMIYSDEDKITPDGRLYDPFFKPDWSPEYLLACMYTCHLGVYRTELIRKVGGWRSPYDSSQDYDLVLRIVATKPRIVHLPDILYHWRSIPSSAASSADAKPEAPMRAARALQSYLDQIGRPGHVEPGPSTGFHRVRYQIKGEPKVSIIIPSACKQTEFRGRTTWLVLECVESIRKLSTYKNVEILVLDDRHVAPELAASLSNLGVRRLSFEEPFNFSKKVNFGARHATGEQLLFLNDDVEVITPDWIESMLEYSQWDEVGAVGAQLLFDDGKLQHCGVTLLEGMPSHQFYCFPGDHPGYFNSAQVHRNWLAVSAACMMTRTDVFTAVGGMTEDYPLNYGDIDYCLKVVQTDRRIVYMPYAKLYHHESATKHGTYVHELEKFRQTWGQRYRLDPFYNPNLTMKRGDFAVG